MNDEIKEILDIFKQVDLEVDVGGCSNCPRIKNKNRTCIGCLNNAKDKLLDYITNLQEERERLIRAWETAVGDFEKEYAKNERAKEVYIKELIEAHNRSEDMPLAAVEMYNILEGNK